MKLKQLVVNSHRNLYFALISSIKSPSLNVILRQLSLAYNVWVEIDKIMFSALGENGARTQSSSHITALVKNEK